MEAAVLWDFDGVLADSLEECFTVTKRVLDREGERLQKEVGKGLEPEYTLEEFARERPHCVNAADFFAHYIASRQRGPREEEHGKQAHEVSQRLLVFLDERYYEQREAYALELEGKYPEKLPPYKGVLETVRELKNKGVRQAVMSARDVKSIREWTDFYRVTDCFESVVGSEVSRADRGIKEKQIKVLRRRLPAAQYFFVDDLAHNLEVVGKADPHIRLVFAEWGYGIRAPANSRVLEKPAEMLSWCLGERADA